MLFQHFGNIQHGGGRAAGHARQFTVPTLNGLILEQFAGERFRDDAVAFCVCLGQQLDLVCLSLRCDDALLRLGVCDDKRLLLLGTGLDQVLFCDLLGLDGVDVLLREVPVDDVQLVDVDAVAVQLFIQPVVEQDADLRT